MGLPTYIHEDGSIRVQEHAFTDTGRKIENIHREENMYFTHNSRDAFEYATAYGLEVTALFQKVLKIKRVINRVSLEYYLPQGAPIGFAVFKFGSMNRRNAKSLSDLNTNNDEYHG